MIPTIAETLRELMRLAKSAGATDAWLATTNDALVELLLERDDLRRAADPRKIKTLQQVRAVRKANDALIAVGATADRRMQALRSQFGLSRSRIHALIGMSCDTQDSNVLDSDHEHSKSLRSSRRQSRNPRQ